MLRVQHPIVFDDEQEEIFSNDESFISACEKRIQKPPNNDSRMALFFSALLELKKKDSRIHDLLSLVRLRRGELNDSVTESHLCILFMRVVQYIKLYKEEVYENVNYADMLLTKDAWRDVIEDILANKYSLLFKLLTERKVSTNIPDRYAGIALILKILCPNKELNILDLGCSFHQGGKKMIQVSEGKDIFHTIIKPSLKKIIGNNHNKPLLIKQIVGIDKSSSQSKDELEWLLACSHYPGNVHQIRQTRARIEILPNAKTPIINTTFQRLAEYFKENEFDIIVFSSVLYQLTKAQRIRTINLVSKLLKDDGIIFIQDTAHKKGDALGFDDDVGIPFSYRLFITGKLTNGSLWELLQFDSNRCAMVKEGKDLSKILSQKKSIADILSHMFKDKIANKFRFSNP
ncbi:hypothetical protein HGB07_00535 [Candidatus Roizmanbacteria bacterium]|nr:hypothetical protein [Candidatus Roizmanbacteria bacterium]